MSNIKRYSVESGYIQWYEHDYVRGTGTTVVQPDGLMVKESDYESLHKALVQIESVCVDNEPDTCNKGMALNFVRDVTREVLRNE